MDPLAPAESPNPKLGVDAAFVAAPNVEAPAFLRASILADIGSIALLLLSSPPIMESPPIEFDGCFLDSMRLARPSVALLLLLPKENPVPLDAEEEEEDEEAPNTIDGLLASAAGVLVAPPELAPNANDGPALGVAAGGAAALLSPPNEKPVLELAAGVDATAAGVEALLSLPPNEKPEEDDDDEAPKVVAGSFLIATGAAGVALAASPPKVKPALLPAAPETEEAELPPSDAPNENPVEVLAAGVLGTSFLAGVAVLLLLSPPKENPVPLLLLLLPLVLLKPVSFPPLLSPPKLKPVDEDEDETGAAELAELVSGTTSVAVLEPKEKPVLAEVDEAAGVDDVANGAAGVLLVLLPKLNPVEAATAGAEDADTADTADTAALVSGVASVEVPKEKPVDAGAADAEAAGVVELPKANPLLAPSFETDVSPSVAVLAPNPNPLLDMATLLVAAGALLLLLLLLLLLPNEYCGPDEAFAASSSSFFFLADLSAFGFSYSQHGHLNSSLLLVTSHCGQIQEPSATGPPHTKGASFASAAGVDVTVALLPPLPPLLFDKVSKLVALGSNSDGASSALSLITKV